MFNVLELEADRTPSSIRHQTTPEPAPAALSLEQLASTFFSIWPVTDLVHDLADSLKLRGEHDTGDFALWLDVSGGQSLGRILDLRRFTRLPGSAGVSAGQIPGRWPLVGSNADPQKGLRDLVADMLLDTLERAGYRHAAPALDEVRSRRSPA
jgi:hypothetical protein